MANGDELFDVRLYIYDLSKGLARTLSQSLIGQQIDGIWHTGVVVYGLEYFYGGGVGIDRCTPGETILGQPDKIHNLGHTEIPKEIFMEFLLESSKHRFKAERYHLFYHNCNTFSNEAAQFLTGRAIPSHITDLPENVLNSPFGDMIRALLDTSNIQGGQSMFPAPGNTTS